MDGDPLPPRQRVPGARVVGAYLREVGAVPSLPLDELLASLPAVLRGEGAAVRQATREHVGHLAREWAGLGVSVRQLMAAGQAGFEQAARTYRPDAGVPLPDYARPLVRQAISRWTIKCRGRANVPLDTVEMLTMLVVVHRRLLDQLGREPTLAEFAEAAERH